MLNTLLYVFVAAAYCAGAACFFWLMLRGHLASGRAGIAITASGLVAQLSYLVLSFFHARDLGLAHSKTPPGIYPILGIVSVLLVLSFLMLSFLFPTNTSRMRSMGAFVLPLATLFFLAMGIPHQPSEHVVHAGTLQSYLLPLHIGLNVLGVVAFALAFGVAIAYLVQESLLRSKRVRGVFQRLPSLETLDLLSLRLVAVGFPLLTLGIVTGTLFVGHPQIVDASRDASLSPSQGMGFVSWAVFAVVLLMRFTVGWRGKKAAWGTILGFLFALLVLAGYAYRSASGGGGVT